MFSQVFSEKFMCFFQGSIKMLLVTTNPGLEDLAIRELSEKLGVRVNYELLVKGRVLVENIRYSNDLVNKLLSLKAVHKVSAVLIEGKVSGKVRGLKMIYKITKKAKPHTYLNTQTTFAIRSERIGHHEYTSIDVAKEAGQAVVDDALENAGFRPKVNLNYPTIIFDSLVIHDKYFFSLRLTGEESLHKRGYRVYDHPAALKPTIAYSMLMLSKLKSKEVFLDPMCGGGTLAIEAAMNFSPRKIICMDISPKHLRGAMLNSIAAGVYEKIKFMIGDAKRLNELIREKVDVIATNPPYGIRLFRREKLKELYEGFLESSKEVLSEEGRIIVITAEYEMLRNIAESLEYKVVKERNCMHGNLNVRILLLKL